MTNNCCIFIDDDPLNRAIFTKALHDLSPDTTCFVPSNGLEAIYLMTEKNIIPRYIFIALNIPGMSGIEFLKLIKQKENLKDIPVIVHSTVMQPHVILQAKELGALALYFRRYEYWSVCNMLSLYFGVQKQRISLS